MSLVGFPSPSIFGISRVGASSSVFRHFSLSSETLGSFTPTGAHSLSHRNSKNCQNGVATSKTTPYHRQGNGQNERYNGIVWKAVQCLLHSTNRPLYDWEGVSPSALSSIRSPRIVPIIASFVSNAASRWSVPPVAHLGSEKTVPPTSGNL